MIKKHKLFQLRAPSLDCAFLPKVKNTDSRCKTRDATKKLYTEDIALVRKTHDAPEQLSKITIKGDNILYPKGVILNEEIISNNSDATPYGLEKDIGNYPHNVISCQVYDNECITTSIPDPNNVNQDERTRLNELRETSEIMIVTENNKLICSSQTKSYLKEDVKPITTSKESYTKQII